MDSIAKGFTQLAVDRSQLDQYPAKKAARARAVNTACREIGKTLFDEITKTSSGTTQELLQKYDNVFGNRLSRHWAGGLLLLYRCSSWSWPPTPKRRL